jgi:hypothetical protein
MNTPFIRNHQYNLIRKQAGLLQHALATSADPKVVDSVRAGVLGKISEAFPDAGKLQIEKLGEISSLKTAEQVREYLRSLEPFLTEFPHITEKQLAKLFPKNKKLKIPDLTAMDYRWITYLGWTDIATNQLFLVYPVDGELAGVQGKFTPANKKSTCFLCNRQEEVALFTVKVRSKPANASPDYYKAIGNYLCLDSGTCNRNITDVAALEKFIHDALGGPAS